MSTTVSHLLGASSKKPDLALFNQHRLTLRKLFLEQNKSLIEVKQEMEALQGFPETDVKTYEYGLRYLGFIKKLSLEGWAMVEARAKKRKEREGKDTDVFLSGVLQDWGKIHRSISRNKRRKQVQDRIERGPTPDCPEGVSLKTPPSSPNTSLASAQSLVTQVPGSLRDVSNANNEAGATPYPNQLLSRAWAEMISNPNPTVHWLRGVSSSRRLGTLMQIAGEPRPFEDTVSYESVSFRLPLGSAPARDIASTSQFLQQLGDANDNINSIIHAHNPSLQALIKVCLILANSLDIEIADRRETLAFLGVNANRPILKLLFALDIPALAAAWISLVRLSAECQSGDAFQALVDFGFETHNSEWIQQHAETLIKLTVALGSRKVGRTAQRLISRKYVRHMRSRINDNALCYVARNLDVKILSYLVAAGVTLQDNKGPTSAVLGNYKEIIHRTARFIRDSPDGMQWIDLLKMAGFDFDINVGTDLFHHKLCLWPDRDQVLYFYLEAQPLPVTFTTLDYLWFIGEYDLYETMASHSERAQTHATIPGLIMAAKAGGHQLTLYLGSRRHQCPGIFLEAALAVASGLGDVAAINSFGEVGVDPNARGLISAGAIGSHWHPLTRAAAAKCFDAVHMLVEMGADTISEIKRFNPLLAAVSKWSWSKFKRVEQLQIVRYFLGKGLAHRYGAEAIIEAAIPQASCYRTGDDPPDDFIPDEEIIHMLCQTGMSLDGIIEENMDALHLAIDRGCNLKTVEFFLSRGAQIHNRCTIDGKTMLHSAATSRSADRWQIVELLLGNGADCNTKDHDGPTILESLLHDLRFKDGRRRENEPTFQLFSFLHDHGAQHTDDLLALLLYNKAPDTLIYRIKQAQVDLNAMPRNPSFVSYMRPLEIAIWRGRLDLARQLLIWGADINAPAHEYGRTALHVACEPQPGVEIPVHFIQFLLSKGVEINARSGYFGRTALHYAIRNGSMGIFCLLLGSGADIHATVRRFGSTQETSSLDLAAQFGRLDMVDILLKKGAESYVQKRTPYDGAIKIAEEYGKVAIAKMLERRVENWQDQA